MARVLIRVLLSLLILFSFGVFAQGIVTAKILQLRIEVSRKQLLNYRLSSELLRSRLRLLFQREQDFSGEIRMSVLESSVMNADLSELPIHVGVFERSGIAATNVVRIMNLKPRLHIDADRRSLLLLQYAFFLERKKRYPEAVVRYRQVMPLLRAEEDRGFSLLHLGYCLTLLGKEAAALGSLEKVAGADLGQHFGEAASELIAVIRENTSRRTEIAKLYTTPSQRAQALFESGQYRRALVELNAVAQPTPSQRLLKARSLEETGNVTMASVEYRAISQAADVRVRRQSVRRLLLLGEFLSADPEVKTFAQKEATRIGEGQAMAEIRQARSVVRAPVLLSQLGRSPKGAVTEPPGGEAALVAELRTLFPQERFVRALPKVTQEGNRVVFVEPPEVRHTEGSHRPVSAVTAKAGGTAPPGTGVGLLRSPPQVRPRDVPPPPKRVVSPSVISRRIQEKAHLEIRFLDGRQLPAESVRLSGGLLRISLADSTVALPFSVVAEIGLAPGHTGQNLSVRFPGGPAERVTRIRRDGPSGFRLLAPGGAETARLGTPEEIILR